MSRARLWVNGWNNALELRYRVHCWKMLCIETSLERFRRLEMVVRGCGATVCEAVSLTRNAPEIFTSNT
jgi:hypothetical protein